MNTAIAVADVDANETASKHSRYYIANKHQYINSQRFQLTLTNEYSYCRVQADMDASERRQQMQLQQFSGCWMPMKTASNTADNAANKH
jgi:hypothetical protein